MDPLEIEVLELDVPFALLSHGNNFSWPIKISLHSSVKEFTAGVLLLQNVSKNIKLCSHGWLAIIISDAINKVE